MKELSLKAVKRIHFARERRSKPEMKSLRLNCFGERCREEEELLLVKVRSSEARTVEVGEIVGKVLVETREPQCEEGEVQVVTW